MKRAGVILAAGRSERMGRAKALLPVGDTTMLGHMVNLLRSACEEIVVVLGHDAERLQQELAPDVVVARNSDYDRGMFSSLQCGLRATDSSVVLFTPVDLPALRRDTVERVAAACAPGVEVVKPRCDGKRGHPVACGARAVEALRTAPANASARDLLDQFPRVIVEVDDPGIYADVDDPAAYQSYLKVASE